MISVTELRTGTTFKLDGHPHQVLEYKHTKLARGTANVKIKARNLASGAVLEKTFISGAKVEPIETEVKPLQFLYQDENSLHFMDPRTFEQFSLDKSILGERAKYLKEESQVRVLFYEGEPLSVELPLSMVFAVVSAPPGVKGDSATASTKPVTLENGLIVQAPLFIKKGDKLKINTRTGKYLERTK
ncbi:hypothetical protein AMJ51_00990 [Microgenomates bacterium DG_75]|nr:MAG: hypothetical protein AMJ51_00990 [Microgenomates bacterium DG_75]